MCCPFIVAAWRTLRLYVSFMLPPLLLGALMSTFSTDPVAPQLNSDICRRADLPLRWHCVKQCVGPLDPTLASLGLRCLLWRISTSLCWVFGIPEKILQPQLSLPLCCKSEHLFDFLNKPRRRKIELIDQYDVSPINPQVSSYTFPVDESTNEIKSLING